MNATDERTALYAAVLADPEDDTVRLAFADWLQENGEDDRAEFVRVQCELAKREPWVTGACPHCGCDDGYNHNTGCLYGREYELYKEHHPEWLKGPACSPRRNCACSTSLGLPRTGGFRRWWGLR